MSYTAPTVSVKANRWAPGGTTSADIQTAIDDCIAGGGGVVDLGGLTYTCTSTITLDPTRVSLDGGRAILDASSGGQTDILLVQTPLSGTQYGHGTQFIDGIVIKGTGSGGTQSGITFYTPTNAVDHSSRITVRNCSVYNVKYGHYYRQNAFCVKVFGGEVYGAEECVRTANESNRGEAICYYGTTLFNSFRGVFAEGSSQDLYFYGCSIDYTTRWAYAVGCHIHWFGCHFEKSPPGNSDPPFEVDGGVMLFVGGSMSFSSGTSSYPYIYRIWGGGGNFYVRDVNKWNLTHTSADECSTPASLVANYI